MQTHTTTNIITEEEIQTLFRTDIGHFEDKSARLLFKHTEHLRGLVQFLSENIAEHLDFSQARRENRSYIDNTLRDMMSDMVFTVPFKDESHTDDLTIYILIEHQSTVDRMMGFRFLSYMCQIWREQLEALENANIPASQQYLSPILPIVFYTGERSWNIPLTLNAVMDVPEIMSPFVPTFETLFLGVKDTDTDEFLQQNHPFGWMMKVLQLVEEDNTTIAEILAEVLTKLESLSDEEAALHAHAMVYLSHLIVSKRPNSEIDNLMQLIMTHNKDAEVERQIMTGAEALIQQGKKQGLKQGLEQGLEQGHEQGKIDEKQAAILRLIRLRFTEVSDAVVNEINRIEDLTLLDTLFDDVYHAESFEDIVLPNKNNGM